MLGPSLFTAGTGVIKIIFLETLWYVHLSFYKAQGTAEIGTLTL